MSKPRIFMNEYFVRKTGRLYEHDSLAAPRPKKDDDHTEEYVHISEVLPEPSLSDEEIEGKIEEAAKVEQKYVRFSRPYQSLYEESASDSYLASQCKGNSGLEKDLANGWLVKLYWEDQYQMIFLLERFR